MSPAISGTSFSRARDQGVIATKMRICGSIRSRRGGALLLAGTRRFGLHRSLFSVEASRRRSAPVRACRSHRRTAESSFFLIAPGGAATIPRPNVSPDPTCSTAVVPLPTTFQTAGTAVTARTASAIRATRSDAGTRQWARSSPPKRGAGPGPARQARPPPARSNPPELPPAAPGFHRAMPPRQPTPPGRRVVHQSRGNGIPLRPRQGTVEKRGDLCIVDLAALTRSGTRLQPFRNGLRQVRAKLLKHLEPGGAAIVLVGHRRRFMTEAFDHRIENSSTHV